MKKKNLQYITHEDMTETFKDGSKRHYFNFFLLNDEGKVITQEVDRWRSAAPPKQDKDQKFEEPNKKKWWLF